MKRIIFILIFVFSFSFSFGVDFTSCGQAISSDTDYVMTGNLGNYSGPCVDLSSVSNVEFSCGGNELFNVTNSGAFNFFPFSGNVRNITIKDCILNSNYIGIRVITSGSGSDVEEIFFENITVYNSSFAAVLLDPNWAGSNFINFSFNKIYFDNSNHGSFVIDIGSGLIENILLNNSIILDGYYRDSFEAISGNPTITSLKILNSDIGRLNVLTLENAYFKNSNFTYLGFYGNNNFFESLKITNGTGLALISNNNTIINSEISSLNTYSSENNSFIGNTFLNLSNINIGASPNNLTGNTYYNVTGGVSSVCFFGGLVCDNSAIVLPFTLEVVTSAVSVASLPSFGFWSLVVSVIAMSVGLLI